MRVGLKLFFSLPPPPPFFSRGGYTRHDQIKNTYFLWFYGTNSYATMAKNIFTNLKHACYFVWYIIMRISIATQTD